MIIDLVKYSVFPTVNFKSTYHHVPLKVSNWKCIAFEANGLLFQSCRILFGVKNGAASFQRAIEKIIKKIYTVFSRTWWHYHCRMHIEHDQKMKRFLEAIAKANISLNKSKSVTSVRSINVLGYQASGRIIKLNPERLRPLEKLPPPPEISKFVKKALGMFAYFVKQMNNFSYKIRLLVEN